MPIVIIDLSILKDQYAQKGTENIFRALSLALPVFTGLAGLYLGRSLTDEDRKKKEKQDLKKIRRLINLDFSRIYHLKNAMRKNHENMYADLQKANAFDKFAIDKTTLTELMRYLKAGLKFYHWKTLENSGSLIKLEPDEIQRLQFAYDQISGVDHNNEEISWIKLALVLEPSLINISDSKERSEFFKIHVNAYFESMFIGYNTVDDAFRQLEISWLDLNLFLKEYPQEKEKLDKSLLSDQKQDTPEPAEMHG